MNFYCIFSGKLFLCVKMFFLQEVKWNGLDVDAFFPYFSAADFSKFLYLIHLCTSASLFS